MATRFVAAAKPMETLSSMTDEQLALRFQQRGDLAALKELRKKNSSYVGANVQRFALGPGHIPASVLAAKADELLVDAARTFKVGTGATFKTHLFNHLRRLDRFTKANANIAYKPESRSNLLTNFNNQVALLTETKQRQPTAEEIADHMSIPVTHVMRMQKSQRREIPWSHGTGTSNAANEKARVDMILDDVSHQLTPDELKVFNLLTGRGGKKKITAGGEIARVTGFSQAKVSQLRTSIANRIKPHLGETVRGAV